MQIRDFIRQKNLTLATRGTFSPEALLGGQSPLDSKEIYRDACEENWVMLNITTGTFRILDPSRRVDGMINDDHQAL
jgi:hypothetical protein